MFPCHYFLGGWSSDTEKKNNHNLKCSKYVLWVAAFENLQVLARRQDHQAGLEPHQRQGLREPGKQLQDLPGISISKSACSPNFESRASRPMSRSMIHWQLGRNVNRPIGDENPSRSGRAIEAGSGQEHDLYNRKTKETRKFGPLIESKARPFGYYPVRFSVYAPRLRYDRGISETLVVSLTWDMLRHIYIICLSI
jgi:hypothetical protein